MSAAPPRRARATHSHLRVSIEFANHKSQITITMSKITDYVVKGFFADNEVKAMQRLAYLFDSNPELMDLFVNGIPMFVEITDKEGLLDEIKKYNKSITSVERVEFTDDRIVGQRQIQFICKEERTRYYKSEDAANKDIYDYKSSETEEYNFKRVVNVNRTESFRDSYSRFINVEYL